MRCVVTQAKLRRTEVTTDLRRRATWNAALPASRDHLRSLSHEGRPHDHSLANWRFAGDAVEAAGSGPAACRSRRLHYFSTTRVEFSRLRLTREDSKRDGKRLSIQGLDHNLRIVN
jgi:hypothetical protein